ncbi:acyltransferase family protein [Arthrobacter sp. NPDC057009]|uniref:acyltransferase family protein n=1 Tax=Arthrobacter sp. NPDC057009 TaxID=3345996 RepID=UPI003640E27A
MTSRLPSPIDAHSHQEGRLHWVDTAKAATILLVVLYHVSGTGITMLFPGTTSFAMTVWNELSRMLLPVRMPLFFLAAGMLASKAIHRPWRTSWRSRFADILWPYILWSVVFALVAGVAYRPTDPWGYTEFSLGTVLQGGTAYWFLPVLVVFFATAKLLRGHPQLTTLVALLLLVVQPAVARQIPEFVPDALATNIGRLVTFALWYFVGCYASTYVRRLAATGTRALMVGAVVIYGGMAYLVYVRGTELPVLTVATVTGLMAAITLSVWASRFAPVRAASRYLSARTLPIYLVHPVLLSVLGGIAIFLGGGRSPIPQDVVLLNVAAVPLMVVVTTAGSLAAYDLAIGSRFRWLFQPPRRVADADARVGR